MKSEIVQTSIAFFVSVALGLTLGAIYEVFRFIRVLFSSKTVGIFFQDVIFSVMAGMGVLLFHFILCDGVIAYYTLSGILGGFILWFPTIGKAVFRLSKVGAEWLKKVMRSLFSPIYYFFVNNAKILFTKSKSFAIMKMKKKENK